MKRSRIQVFVTAILLVALIILVKDFIVPLSMNGAVFAVCGYRDCIVDCEGTNCGCGHVGPDYVACYCDWGMTIMWCGY